MCSRATVKYIIIIIIKNVPSALLYLLRMSFILAECVP